MGEDTARHALSMDQVLMSVKKTFTDDEPAAGIDKTSASLSPPAASLPDSIRAQHLPDSIRANQLPDSIRAQQKRLGTLHTRRTKLPPLPKALKAREQQGSAPVETIVPPHMHTDVPKAVEINAVQAPAAPSSGPGRDLRAGAETDGLGLSELALPIVGDTDWESLKADLQAVVDEWVERQKHVRR
ncbi:hypothetical protein N9M21_01905 [Alphaproteobacteria bacterium]|nr:hypothetical protein [Alphaproteobacteria bacterium]